MGLFSHLITYKIGRSRGRKTAQRQLRDELARNDRCDPDCINYHMFCKNFGSCDGQVCEYDN